MEALGKPRLRRCLSDHPGGSTGRAWDGFWKRAREKRLTGRILHPILGGIPAVLLKAEQMGLELSCPGQDFLACRNTGIASAQDSDTLRFTLPMEGVGRATELVKHQHQLLLGDVDDK
ncbi:hypothetical protein AAES_47418 [Amazona aestiva]|uniref:Uncharacterized protein n=1 Tax=Amazona aestiva TaxID=12930 RepID=A0A0Q3UU03_AMAAE|nr:hypothetical protein AAES_47418 [Amazona aestiva]